MGKKWGREKESWRRDKRGRNMRERLERKIGERDRKIERERDGREK